MAEGGDKPGGLNLGLIAVGGVLLLGEMMGIAGFYSAVSGGELIFIQAVISIALIMLPIGAFFAFRSEMKKKQKK